ncbi:hypothetical protein [Seleniivibrio woodruffii]|uniref:XRE family transcriptional regulator n=1 Tax=Seleniivibrio woodruffii TaxID=1078050 RepID=A0A4R1K2V5_9BACT|nr:hypothetical protein [Seleniivibrio woodruffii]TCK58375.1 hypothetical protein C8D98_2576 [Seleniivibrio woodruffii]TVZ36749.1 hypothetical protein OF66_2386 [Seleniivibrio woodruffii]
MEIRLKPEYLEEIKKKHTTYSLGKILSNHQAIRIFSGEANITLKSYYVLCKAMGWDFPEYFSVKDDAE